MRKVFLLFALTGCGTEVEDYVHRVDVVDKRTPHVEEEFIPHVDKFKAKYKIDFHILIEWAPLDEKTMGVCYSWTDGHREIKIDTVKWSGLTYEGQEQLLFHELGHCILNLDHDDHTMDMGGWKKIPVSIMYPYAFGNMKYYAEFADYYYDQLGAM